MLILSMTMVDHLDFSSDNDDPPVDERTNAINELFREVKDKAKLIARNASSLSEYVRAFLLDYYYTNFAGLAWLYDESKGQMKGDALVRDLETGEKAVEIDKLASAIRDMYDRLVREPDREGFVRVAVIKIRKGDNVSGLRVLAIFPGNVDILRAGFDEQGFSGDSEQQIVYYEPQTACWEHAADDARKLADENGGVYYLPIQKSEEAQKNFKPDAYGKVEYVIGRDEKGERVKQDMPSYLWVSLVRRAYGENKHFVVSDYWNRK